MADGIHVFCKNNDAMDSLNTFIYLECKMNKNTQTEHTHDEHKIINATIYRFHGTQTHSVAGYAYINTGLASCSELSPCILE